MRNKITHRSMRAEAQMKTTNTCVRMLLRKMLFHPPSLFLFFVPIPLSFFSRFMQINAFQSKSKCERSSLKKKQTNVTSKI
jgi:hypothetical protein